MGLFGLFKKKDWTHFQKKGDAQVKRGEFGLALQEFRSAEKRFDGDDEQKAELHARMRKVRGELREQQLERYRGFLRGKAWDRAESALESALGHSTNEDERREIAELERELGAAQRAGGAKKDDIRKHLPDEALEPGNSHFVALLGAMSDAQADHYQSLGESFKAGFVALHEGRSKDAVANLKRAREDHPDDGYVVAEHGLAIIATSKLKQGFDVLKKGEAMVGDSVYLKLRVAESAWFLEDWKTAERALQEAHDLSPNDEAILSKIAEHGLLSGDYDAGIDAIEHVLEHSRRAGTSHMKLHAQLLLAKGDTDQGIAKLEGVMKATTRIGNDGQLNFDPEAAMVLAQAYVRQERRPERVVELLVPMVEMTQGPNRAAVLLTMAKAYRLSGDADKGLDAIERALAAAPRGDDTLRAVLKNEQKALVAE